MITLTSLSAKYTIEEYVLVFVCVFVIVGQVYLDIPFSKVYEGGVSEDGHQDQHQ